MTHCFNTVRNCIPDKYRITSYITKGNEASVHHDPAERKGPGRLVNLTNMLLLHSFAGLKTAVGAAAWAGASLLGKTDERFPIYLRTTAGRPFTMTVVSFF